MRLPARPWGPRLLAVYFVVVLGVIGVTLDRMHPEVRARLAAAMRDPAMDLKRPFRSCGEAQAAGYSDIPRGSPAYVPWQDADHDGLACEPYPRASSGGGFSRRLMRLRTLAPGIGGRG